MSCECKNWARAESPYKFSTRSGIPLVTNHHPNCPHYSDSLMDVWKTTVDGVSAYTDNEQDAKDLFGDDWKNATVTKEKMHREIFENLPEFEGF